VEEMNSANKNEVGVNGHWGGYILSRKYATTAAGLKRIPSFLNAARITGSLLENYVLWKGLGESVIL
jgi:hypothetical protein